MIHLLCLLLACHRIEIIEAWHFAGGPGIEETVDIDAAGDNAVRQSGSRGRT